ncbi:MAG: hypothetical protein L0229_05310 [Blastocatellia bacterium]|nr:hypothetical protein [Blastocatellia bacterium]
MSALTGPFGVGYKLPMTPTILTVIIAASAVILSIFAASWLNLRSKEKLFDRLDKQLAAHFGELRAEIESLRKEMKSEFAALREEMKAL